MNKENTNNKAHHKLPNFEKMLSTNVFIRNNIRLREDLILPDWVDWIQLGLPTRIQLRHFPDTSANFRMSTNNKQFIVCGRIRDTDPPIIESWAHPYRSKINQAMPDGKYIVGLTSQTKIVLESVWHLMRNEFLEDQDDDQPANGTQGRGRLKEISIKDKANESLGLQSFFWKTELGEAPPEVDESNLYPSKDIINEYNT